MENMQLYDLINMINKQSKLEILNNYRIDLECRGIFFIFIKGLIQLENLPVSPFIFNKIHM